MDTWTGAKQACPTALCLGRCTLEMLSGLDHLSALGMINRSRLVNLRAILSIYGQQGLNQGLVALNCSI